MLVAGLRARWLGIERWKRMAVANLSVTLWWVSLGLAIR